VSFGPIYYTYPGPHNDRENTAVAWDSSLQKRN